MRYVSARYVTREELGTLAGQPSTTSDNLGIVAELPDEKLVLIEVDQDTFETAVADAKSRATAGV